MAIVLKLAHTDLSDLNFQAGDAGFQLKEDGWLPGVSLTGEPVAEVLRLNLKRSSTDNMATSLQDLAEYQVHAQRYFTDSTVDEPVWFHCKMADETGERRVAVRSLDWSFAESQFDGKTSAGNLIVINLTITRQGAWERTAALSMPASTPSAAAALLYDYSTTDIVGDVAARMVSFSIQSNMATLDRLWLGLRSSDKNGVTAGNFDPIWECEAGVNDGISSDDTTSEVNTASPGSGSGAYVDTTGSGSWSRAFYLSAGAGASNPSDQLGLMLWLLRCKVTSGTYQIQVRWGNSGTAKDWFARGPITEVTNTNWDYINVGTYQTAFMTNRFQNTAGGAWGIDNFALHVFIKRTVGSGDIYFDCFNPVPVDEGFLIASGYDVAAGENLNIMEAPDGRFWVQQSDGTDFEDSGDFEVDNFRLPKGDGRMVVVYARASQSVLTDTIGGFESGSDYYPRWLSLRGSE